MINDLTHFENTWIEAENLAVQEVAQKPLHSIVMELDNLLGLYEALDANEKIAASAKPELKSHLFGKFLLVCAQFSLKEDINVWASMQQVLEEERLSLFKSKYQHV